MRRAPQRSRRPQLLRLRLLRQLLRWRQRAKRARLLRHAQRSLPQHLWLWLRLTRHLLLRLRGRRHVTLPRRAPLAQQRSLPLQRQWRLCPPRRL